MHKKYGLKKENIAYDCRVLSRYVVYVPSTISLDIPHSGISEDMVTYRPDNLGDFLKYIPDNEMDNIRLLVGKHTGYSNSSLKEHHEISLVFVEEKCKENALKNAEEFIKSEGLVFEAVDDSTFYIDPTTFKHYKCSSIRIPLTDIDYILFVMSSLNLMGILFEYYGVLASIVIDDVSILDEFKARCSLNF